MSTSETVLLLADRRQSHTHRALQTSGYRVTLSFTPDHAVALCVNQKIDAVILDQQHFVVTDDWSIAQSIKMVRRRICVILMVRGKILGSRLPSGIDVVIPEGDTEALLKALKEML